MDDRTIILYLDQLERALELVRINGELDFAWSWRIDRVQTGLGDEGWLVSAEFKRPDRDTGVDGWGRGRALLVRRGDSAHDVWRSAYIAIKGVLEHELSEAFHVGGRRIYDPHAPMTADLLAVRAMGTIDAARDRCEE